MVVVLVLNGVSRCEEGYAVVYHPNRDEHRRYRRCLSLHGEAVY